MPASLATRPLGGLSVSAAKFWEPSARCRLPRKGVWMAAWGFWAPASKEGAFGICAGELEQLYAAGGAEGALRSGDVEGGGPVLAATEGRARLCP